MFRSGYRSVPVLVTWDVDPDSWIDPERRLQALGTAMDLCSRRDIPATFFVTAGSASEYRDELKEMHRLGHEVGCHGLTHGTEENYDQMPEEMQRSYIVEATQKLHALTGGQIRVFRAPRAKTSATTLKLLTENGYLADSSVCSQRMDFVSSNLINLGWLFAPRRPYRPHPGSAFRAGYLPIWEVPVSAVIVPFISATFRVLGLQAMKALFKLLYAESRRTGKPIVYLAHPTEFVGDGRVRSWKDRLWFAKPEYFKPSVIRAHGFLARTMLYRVGGRKLLAYTQELLDYMASFPGVKFMTVGEYTVRHLE